MGKQEGKRKTRNNQRERKRGKTEQGKRKEKKRNLSTQKPLLLERIRKLQHQAQHIPHEDPQMAGIINWVWAIAVHDQEVALFQVFGRGIPGSSRAGAGYNLGCLGRRLSGRRGLGPTSILRGRVGFGWRRRGARPAVEVGFVPRPPLADRDV